MHFNVQFITGKNRIRQRLIGYFLLTTLLMGLASLYTYYVSGMFLTRVDDMFMKGVYLNELYNNVNQLEKYLGKFIATNHNDSLKEYLRLSEELREKGREIKDNVTYSDSGLILRDIGYMIDTYLSEADAAVNSKLTNKSNYKYYYDEAVKTVEYINFNIDKLSVEKFQENTTLYLSVSGRLNTLQHLSITFIVIAVLFNGLLILWFTFKISKPIVGLSEAANKISQGDFDVDEVVVDTNDEIKVMADAFNKMAASIRNYIHEIKEKAYIENLLKEQEMQNLLMKNLLKEAELHALQAQINPHFIFNTLNAGVQLAMLEGADKTSTFIENVANMLRYNLRNFDRPVTLKEEIENIDKYIYILKTRFGDKIRFMKNVDTRGLEALVPCMILQPLIENAFIHGISEMKKGGDIVLGIQKMNDEVEIIIEDNGKGISGEKIEQIFHTSKLKDDNGMKLSSGGSTGLGLKNVINRLKLYYNREQVVKIISCAGEGTKVIINIPVVK